MLLFLVQPSVDCCRFCLPVTPGLLLPPLLPMGDFFIDNIHFAVTLAVTADYVVANLLHCFCLLQLPLMFFVTAVNCRHFCQCWLLLLFLAAGILSPLS